MRNENAQADGGDESRGPVVVLGAGLAGLAAARALSRRGRRVLVIEASNHLGGLAAGDVFAGAEIDLGSHRIHPAYLPEALAVLRELLGDEILRVPRRGRLRLNGRFVDYPPSLIAFVRALGPRETVRCALSLLASRLNLRRHEDLASYESHLLPKVGRRAYDLFYAPYARKLYGIEPAEIDRHAAKLRVSTGSPLSLLREAARIALGGERDPESSFFFYPARGFGSIGEALGREACAGGAEIVLGARIERLEIGGGGVARITFESAGVERSVVPSAVVSTLTLNTLVGLLDVDIPEEVAAARGRLRWRGIRLLRVELSRERCLDGETYYFPESRYLFGRVSEPRLYSAGLVPPGRGTILSLEVICSPGDHLWSMDDAAFFERVTADAEAVDMFRRYEVACYDTVRLPQVYPVYCRGYREDRDRVLAWIESFGNLYSIGRGGLFLHANTDHSIFIGLRLAEHLLGAGARANGWRDAIDDSGFVVRD